MGDRVGVKHKLPRQQEKGESLGIKAFPPHYSGHSAFWHLELKWIEEKG
jgi:hypothetical protein